MEGTIGEIRMFGGHYTPRNWALCQGQLLEVSKNPSLFTILGSTYGGNGRTTFGLPDLRGRVPLSPGTGPGLSMRKPGQQLGTETVTLNAQQMPTHSHTGEIILKGINEYEFYIARNSKDKTPGYNYFADAGLGNQFYGTEKDETKTMSSEMVDTRFNGPLVITNTGDSHLHNNMQPSLAVNYIICLVGTFPSRS